MDPLHQLSRRIDDTHAAVSALDQRFERHRENVDLKLDGISRDVTILIANERTTKHNRTHRIEVMSVVAFLVSAGAAVLSLHP